DQRHEVQVQAEAVADEREPDGDDRVREEPADEDPVVIDAVQLGPNRSDDRVERREDGHGRVAAEFEADRDVEQQPGEHADEQTRQGEYPPPRPLSGAFGQGYPTRPGRATSR